MSLTADIKTLLTSIDPNVFRGSMPDSPDNVICLYDTGGYNPTDTKDGREYERPTFQVKIRNISYDAGYAIAEKVKDALHLVRDKNINGHFYSEIKQMTDILSLGKDTKERSEFTVNFECKIRR